MGGRFPNQFTNQFPSRFPNGFRDQFGSGLRSPKRFRLNRFGLDKVKPIKPKLNHCRSLLVTPTPLLGLETWGLSLHKVSNQRDLEKP